MKILIHGTGTMGSLLKKTIENNADLSIGGFVDELTNETGDVIISFSHYSRIPALLFFAVSKKIPLLIATTGYSSQDSDLILDASKKIPLLLASNVSLGISVMIKILQEITPILQDTYDIEIIEKHHNQKSDAPSGTAKALANAIKHAMKKPATEVCGRVGNKKREKHEIGIQAIRGGTIAGEHAVLFCGEDEILEIKHTVTSKNIFVRGAIKAARILIQKEIGFYTMEQIIS